MSTIKVVCNKCFGQFPFSPKAWSFYNEKRINAGLAPIDNIYFANRSDPLLIEVVDELGSDANNEEAQLRIVEIPSEYKGCYTIHSISGYEDIICDPKDLIMERLRELDLTSDIDCRAILSYFVSILGDRKSY